MFADKLIRYIISDARPEITPAIWQDVEIYIRYKKRDVWFLSDQQKEHAERGMMLYRIKYVIEHLTKAEIVEVFNQFYIYKGPTLMELFEKRFHAPIDSLFLTQEKHTITEANLDNFDKLFDYPAWLEFDDAANQIIFDKIYKNQLTDEQIDYFLGASDNLNGYAEWFKIIKYILTTTKNAHTFWTAGDVLSIIRRAVPEDAESQKWFDDQIFEIFWPRIQSVWPMLNQDKINFEHGGDARILRDSIGWLETLSDLKERLPELGENYALANYSTPSEEFARDEEALRNRINSGANFGPDVVDEFFELTEIACSESSVQHLKQLAEESLIPKVESLRNELNVENIISMVREAVRHGENVYRKNKTEGENLSENLIRNSKE